MGTVATPTLDASIEPDLAAYEADLQLVSSPSATATPSAGSGGNTPGNPQNCASWDFLCKATNGYFGITPNSGVPLPQIAPNTGTPGTSWTAPGGVNLGLPSIQQFFAPIGIGLVAIIAIAIGLWALVGPNVRAVADDTAKVASKVPA